MATKKGVFFSLFLIFTIFILMNSGAAEAQTKVTRISIATGGTGGVYYPLGGGMANVISKYVPNTEATAEVTSASVDNCKLIQARKADLALIMADVGYDALKGMGRFKASGAIPVRTVVVPYPNLMHFVSTEGTGIKSMKDLKGSGSPLVPGQRHRGESRESGLRTDAEGYRAERLGRAESAGALMTEGDAFA
jgi:TRAP transporter TAXI family solute receptor